jgi:hypothetical protein
MRGKAFGVAVSRSREKSRFSVRNKARAHTLFFGSRAPNRVWGIPQTVVLNRHVIPINPQSIDLTIRGP